MAIPETYTFHLLVVIINTQQRKQTLIFNQYNLCEIIHTQLQKSIVK